MTLHAPSAHFIADQCLFSNHVNVSQRVNPSVFTFFKTCGKTSGTTCGVYIGSSVFGYDLIQFREKPKANLRKKHIVFASRKKKDEPERGSSRPYTEEEMLKSIFVVSETNQNPKDSDVDIAASVSNSEADLIKGASDHLLNQGNLLDKLKAVHLHVLALEQWNASRLKMCHRNYIASATNLIHQLALKCLDVEQLKEELSSTGLLNLDTINPYVLASITAMIQMLENQHSLSRKTNIDPTILNLDVVRAIKSTWEDPNQRDKEGFTIKTMRKRASSHKDTLLGPLREERTTHIMVTVGKEATENDTLLSDLLRAGASIIRINCAYGEPCVWSEIIRRAKKSSQMLEKPCRILMDLAGPKLRTGPMEVGPSVIKISPKKDASGNVIFPAQVWLSHPGSGGPPAHLSPDAALLMDNEQLLNRLEVGNVLRFYDARGKRRVLKVTKKFPVFAGIGCVAECSETAYVEWGTTMTMKGKKGRSIIGNIVEVPSTEQSVRLKTGDLLTISRDPCLTPEPSGESTINAPRITCSSSHLFDSVKPGEPIAFDDGRIWGVIQGTSISEIIVSVTRASPNGSKLGSGKSINIPESQIRFEGLTSKDLMDLDYVASHADMVGISFVRDVRDVVVLQKELEKRKLWNLGVVLKIETQSGFEKLPLLLLQAMRSSNPLGIMIARGDLAVECGWERLADMQDEIISTCGAAHIPVIWATQVLESLVKSGLPTRAEITDVASGRRASCIMLNKGKFITEAVSSLDSMLRVGSKKMKAELKPLVLSSHIS